MLTKSGVLISILFLASVAEKAFCLKCYNYPSIPMEYIGMEEIECPTKDKYCYYTVISSQLTFKSGGCGACPKEEEAFQIYTSYDCIQCLTNLCNDNHVATTTPSSPVTDGTTKKGDSAANKMYSFSCLAIIFSISCFIM